MISLQEYNKKKENLVNSLKEAIKNNKEIGLKKKISNLFRHREKNNVFNIDVRNFNNVINIDIKNLTAEVEGMCTYEKLVDETLKFNLMPNIVPELKTITIGGATTGIGIESSSFKYGLVHETITEIEVLLSDGSVILCSENKNKDLFFGFPNSYGTFGYALKLKVKLIPVKKYIHIKHVRCYNANKYFKDLKKICMEGNYDFIDGEIFDENEMYITFGKFTEDAPYSSNYKYINIYYKSIQNRK